MRRIATISLSLMLISIITIGCLDNDETYLPETLGIPPIISNLTITDKVTNLSYTGATYSLIQDREYVTTVSITDGDSDISARLKLAVAWTILTDLPAGQPSSGTSTYWLYDDGTGGDTTAGDHIYTGTWVRSIEADDFTEDVYLYVTDNKGNASNMYAVRFNFNRYAGDAPAMVTNVRHSEATEVSSTGFTFHWDEVAGATSYKIYLDSSYHSTVSSSATSAAVSGLNPGTSYDVQVSAVNNVTEGPKSGVHTITTWTDLTGHSLETSIPVGHSPWDLVLDPNDNAIYVSNWGSNTISVIQRFDHAVDKVINGGIHPSGGAAEPGGQYVYIANSAVNDGTVSVVKISDNSISDSVTVANRPRDVAVDPTGSYAYVTRLTADRVTVVDILTNDVDSEIAVGDGPDAITAVPGSTYIYVGNSYENTLTVINSGTNSVHTSIDVGNGPRALAPGTSGSYVYAANWYDDTISVVDTATNTVSATVNVGNGPQAVAATDDYVYVANYFDDTVTVIRVSNNTVAGTINLNGSSSGNGEYGPRALAVDSDGDFLYVANHNTDNVHVYRIAE